MKKCLVILFFIFYFLQPFSVHAETSTPSSPALGPVPTPNPQPAPIACNVYMQGKEFHSLRPYQASPCLMEITEPSKLCGNTMLINDAITVSQNNGSCQDIGNNSVKCHYSIPRSFTIQVDPSRAELPIAGNTELVRNRYNADATIDNATQVNDYLSWYLNGTIFRAEEINRFKKDPTTGIYDYSPFVDYAGPIRKLLPLVIQNQARSAQVNNAVAGTVRHDQTVACIYDINLFKFDVTILGFNIKSDGINIGGIPAPCPVNTGKENILQKLWSLLDPINPTVPKELKLTDWEKHLPPEQESGESFQNYYKRYLKWRGKYCFSIKIPDSLPLAGGMEVMYCAEDPTTPNFWANEFPFIPFTSTEDKLGDLTFNIPQSSGGGVKVSDNPAPVFKNLTTGAINTPISTNLYFPHMEENKQLSQLLSSSYLPKDLQGDSSLGTTVPISPAEIQNNCKILDIRTNPGDKLFGNVSALGSYSYTADFDCEFTWHYETTILGVSIQVWEPSECKKNATFASTINVNTPMIDKTWATLVAGNTSDFRRIFPKLDSAGLGDIKDMPAVSSNVIYTAQSTKSNGVTSAGPNPAEIYFPHLGGISEYFLKAIQTLLRPKGFGETIEFANQSKQTTNNSDVCAIAKKYNMPCCMLQGIMATETGGTSNYSGSCGNFSCCHGNYCGPAGIACGQYAAFNGNDNLDMCSVTGTAELLARALLLKKCQADKVCTSYDWKTWGDQVLANYSIADGEYTPAGYFYGMNQGCVVSACTQYRWGAGKSYCDSVKSYCETGQILEAKTDPGFCEECNKEIVGAGQNPIQCNL